LDLCTENPNYLTSTGRAYSRTNCSGTSYAKKQYFSAWKCKFKNLPKAINHRRICTSSGLWHWNQLCTNTKRYI